MMSERAPWIEFEEDWLEYQQDFQQQVIKLHKRVLSPMHQTADPGSIKQLSNLLEVVNDYNAQYAKKCMLSDGTPQRDIQRTTKLLSKSMGDGVALTPDEFFEVEEGVTDLVQWHHEFMLSEQHGEHYTIDELKAAKEYSELIVFTKKVVDKARERGDFTLSTADVFKETVSKWDWPDWMQVLRGPR